MSDDIEHAFVNWRNTTGLKEAGRWLDRPEDAYSDGYAASVMSVCASLPVELIDLLQPRRLAPLAKLRAQAQRLDFEEGATSA